MVRHQVEPVQEMKYGRKWYDVKGGLPRLYLHEKNEKRVRWALRSITSVGVVMSVVSLPWYYSLSTAVILVGLDFFLEKTLFYYSSLYVGTLMEDYDPDEWVATSVISHGEPTDPRSRMIVGLVFRTKDYANRFFDTLHGFNSSSDDRQKDLCLTFVIDEDMYFVYLYARPDKSSVTEFKEKVEEENKFEKYGKEHFMLSMQMTICKGFETTRNFAIGMFLDNNPPGKEFLLAPYVLDPAQGPMPIDDAQPIVMTDYKAKIATDLDKTDYEYFHWHKRVDRKSLGSDA